MFNTGLMNLWSMLQFVLFVLPLVVRSQKFSYGTRILLFFPPFFDLTLQFTKHNFIDKRMCFPILPSSPRQSSSPRDIHLG